MASRKRLIVSALLGTLIALGASYALGAPHIAKPKFDRCFPAKLWDGEENHPDNVRPCARILHVYEDGSLELGVYDANGTERYTFGAPSLSQ